MVPLTTKQRTVPVESTFELPILLSRYASLQNTIQGVFHRRIQTGCPRSADERLHDEYAV